MDVDGEIAVRSPLNETNNLGIGGWDNIREDGYIYSLQDAAPVKEIPYPL
jgi:hypothetical protein